MKNKKTKRMIAGIVAGFLAFAMVAGTILGALFSMI